MQSSQIDSWPELPYKGLSFYGSEDSLLFAAREDAVVRFAERLSDPSIRILILHGRTGCGKSSFLRAGLIPYLERPEHGFQFVRHDSKDGGASQQHAKAVFVRCTDKPLVELAEEVFRLCTSTFEVATPIGKTKLDLGSVLQGRSKEDFVRLAGSDPIVMTETLSALADLVPQTLVVVVDQAEEVLTLRTDDQGLETRTQFFDFMAEFSNSAIDLKLLISLRTEWYGLFYNEIRRRTWDSSNIQEEVLRELTVAQLAIAIAHPASHSGYGFSYEEGLPAHIAKDLGSNPMQGGVLPVMQIVCSRLYEQAKKRAASEGELAIIGEEDYKSLGGVEQQVEKHVSDVLADLCAREGLNTLRTELEIGKWYQVLDLLVRIQVDGTVTTDQKLEEELRREAQTAGCVIDFDKAILFLSDEKQRILQRFEVLNLTTKMRSYCCSLGHDAIGLALKSWRSRRTDLDRNVRKILFGYRIFGVVGVLAGAFVVFALNFVEIGIAIAGYGVLFFTMTLVPSRYFKLLVSVYLLRTKKGRRDANVDQNP